MENLNEDTNISFIQLENLLKQLLQPNTEIIRQTENILNKFLKKRNSINDLLEILQKSQLFEIRQLSGILMRKKIVGHWGKLSKESQEKIKKILLEMFINDPNYHVRKTCGNLISTIAHLLIPIGQWKELLDFLYQCTQSQESIHRENSINLFESLTEVIGEHLKPYFSVLQKIFLKGLQDVEINVRISSLKALGSLVQWITNDQEVLLFKELLPFMIPVIQYCLQNQLNDEIIQAFEVFDELVETPIKLIDSCIPDLVKFSLEVGNNKLIDLNVRKKALTFVEWVIKYKPKTIIKFNLISSILQVIFPMCAEPDEEFEDDSDSASRFAANLLDILSLHEPPKYIFQPAMNYIKQYINSNDSNQRRASIIGLAFMAEGCSEIMGEEETLKYLLTLVYNSCKDPNHNVREAAYIALAQFAQYLQPNILQHYQTLIPYLFQSFDDPSEKVKMGLCYAIESYCQFLGKEIIPYIEPLLMKLVYLLQQNNNDIKEIAISAICSTVSSAEKAFIPYYTKILPIMKQFMLKNEDEFLRLRCRATECVGHIALAIGKEFFQNELKDFMNLAFQGLSLDYLELKEYTYGFFGNISLTFKEDFAEFLPTLVPILISSCSSTDGITPIYQNTIFNNLEIESDEEEEDINPSKFGIRDGFLDEKSSAVKALGTFAESTKGKFALYLY